MSDRRTLTESLRRWVLTTPEHTMHLLKSFGSTPGRALMSRGSM